MGDITKTEPAAAPAMRTRPWTPFIRGVQAVALAAGVVFAVACSGAEPAAATATAPLPATRLTEATPASAAAENSPTGAMPAVRLTEATSSLAGAENAPLGSLPATRLTEATSSLTAAENSPTGAMPAVRLTEATSLLTAAENAPVRLSPDTVPATGVTLSANDASISELATAFESAGISNAQRWAREVDEYRPYSVDDTGYTKLRGELAKYNPASGVVDAIVARLHLP